MKHRAAAWIVLLLAAISVAIFPLARLHHTQTDADALARLAKAVGADRRVTPRLVGGFSFGPLRTPERGARHERNVQLLSVAADLQQSVSTKPALRPAWAVAQLLLGDPEGALLTLEPIVGDSDETAADLSNLAAIYASRASDGPGADWFHALALCERALAKTPTLQEALFNRALALDALQLRHQAVLAWGSYLDVDDHSGWAAEARGRVAYWSARPILPDDVPESFAAALRSATTSERDLRALITRNPQATRELLEDRWLTDFLESGDVSPVALDVSRGLQHVTGDSSLSDLYQLLRESPSVWRDDVRVFLEVSRAAAASDFALIRDLLRARPSRRDSAPLTLWLDYYRLQGAAERGDAIDETLSDLAALERAATRANYSHLAGTAANRAGQLFGRLGRQQESIAARDRAILALNKARDDDLVATMHALIAESLRLNGDSDGALRRHQFSLAKTSNIRTYRARHQVFVQAGLSALAGNLPEAAVHCFLEARQNGREWSAFPAAEALATLRLATALRAAGVDADARLMIEDAARLINAIPDSGFRERNELELIETKSALLPAVDALVELDRAIAKFRVTGYAVRLPRLQWLKARRLAEIKDLNAALQSIEEGIRQLQVDRASLTDDQLRRSQSETFIQLQTEAASILLGSGDAVGALDRADSIKALSLEENRRPGASGGRVTSTALVGALGADTAVLVISDIHGQINGWLVTSAGVSVAPSLIGTSQLRTVSARFREAVQDDNYTSARELGRILGEKLIAPVLRSAPAGIGHIVIVPSTECAGLPFAALILDDGRYLIERVGISIEPSLEMVRRHLTAGGIRQRVAVAVEDQGRGELPPLPMAQPEGERVARLYRTASITRGDEGLATLLKRLNEVDVFHFVGHAVVANGQSALIFGDRAESDLTAERIRGLQFPRLRTVVLAACSTAFSANSAKTIDALLSSAAPFLSSGVPEVIGTLWPIEDRVAFRLSMALHEHLLGGNAAVVAVTAVQRRAILERVPISEWSAIQIVGSPTNLQAGVSK